MTTEEELIKKSREFNITHFDYLSCPPYSGYSLYGLGPTTLKNEKETVLEAVNKTKDCILVELQHHHKETEVRFDLLDSANTEIKKLQKEIFEKTENIEELNKDIVKMLELLKTDIANPKQIQLYNFEMLFGIGIIAISVTLFLMLQSIPLLILFLITGFGILTTAFVSKRKVLEIRKECDAI